MGDVTATRDATPTVNERAGEHVEDRRDDARESPFDPPRERFETRGELGRGGMGRVADAYDRALDRPVAIKEMLTDSSVDLARFEREARITARLEHPGIVPIHDAGRTGDGTPFYVMRRIDGQPLDRLIDDKLVNRLALIPNVLAACDAIAFAHARGVVHRDLKPTNILVGPFGETLVIDWGLARELGTTERTVAIPASDPKLTRAGTVAGTPGFMSPEQARGESVDARADVFALGATLFFVLAGQPPYGSASATEMVDLAGAGREADWRRIPDAVPPELRAIAKKAMAPSAARRYGDAGALAADLRRFVTGNLVGAYDYGLAARFVRLVRRHRAAVAVAAISALVVVAIAVLAVRRIVSERDDANAARGRAQRAANRLLVQHARALADSDPVAAVIALRGLPSASGEDVWTPAVAAFMHGIPFGFAGTSADSYGVLQISRDGRRAIVPSRKDGSITVVDLVAHTSRVVAAHCFDAAATAWLGPDHAVCLGVPAKLVDLRTGQARTLDLGVNGIYGDRGSRVWLATNSTRLLELDDPDKAPLELATGVTAITVSDDLNVALLGFGDRWEVRLPDRTLAIPIELHDATGFVSKDRVALYDGTSLRVWRIESGGLVLEQTIPEPIMLSAVLANGAAFVSTPSGLRTVRDGRSQLVDSLFGRLTQTSRGAMMLTDDGSIRLYDGAGWTTIDRHADELTHADLSPDGTYLVATTGNGEILVWDLRALAPVRARIPAEWVPVKMTPRSLWVMSPAEGVGRIDVQTGELETVISHPGTLAMLADDDDRWAAAYAPGGELTILDRIKQQRFTLHVAAVVTTDAIGIVLARDDGTLWRWRPGAEHLESIESAGGSVDILAAQHDWVAALAGTSLVRVDTATKRVERIAAPPHVEMLQVRDDGQVYVLAAGAVWGWRAGTNELVRVPIAEPIRDLGSAGHAFMMSTANSLIALDDGIMHVTPIQSGNHAVYVNGRHAVLRGDRGAAIVADLYSGLSFALPQATAMDDVVAQGRRVAAVTWMSDHDKIISIWDLDIPEEPHALAAWLAGITNARAVGDSEIYAWP
ncbi:MAG TPA: serine/threonine-protein kinase [Kofleriaceae bacterium]